MTTIVAALNHSAASPVVVGAAQALAPLFCAELDLVHVVEPGDGAAPAPAAVRAAEGARLPLRLLEGRPAERIVEELGAPDVVAGVLGARGAPSGRRPAGSTALWVLEHALKPVLVVPPEWEPGHELTRVVVPLDAAAPSWDAVRRAVEMCAGEGLEVFAVHVFTAGAIPRFWDRPAYEEDDWGREFLRRRSTMAGTRMAVRVGSPAHEVLEVARGIGDVVVLAWSQDLSGGHAQMVRELLADSPAPVLLVPIRPSPL